VSNNVMCWAGWTDRETITCVQLRESKLETRSFRCNNKLEPCVDFVFVRPWKFSVKNKYAPRCQMIHDKEAIVLIGTTRRL
jgi:hypothetical protein